MKRLIRRASSLTLYHGTSSVSALKILESGQISPRNETKTYNQYADTWTMNWDAVYLSKSIDGTEYYSGVMTGGEAFDEFLPVVFEIALDSNDPNFFTDEDTLKLYDDEYLIELLSKYVNDEKMVQYYLDAIKDEDFSRFNREDTQVFVKILSEIDPQDSMNKNNSDSVAYEGSIPISKCTNLIVYVDEQGTQISCEPNVNALKALLDKYLKS